MKYLFLIPLLFIDAAVVFSQNNTVVFLGTNDKRHLYFITLNDTSGAVYEIGTYAQKESHSWGYQVISMDTLTRQPEGGYRGAHSHIIEKKHTAWLITNTGNKKSRKYRLNIEANVQRWYTMLNNAWYLHHFVATCQELKQQYPMCKCNMEDAFSTWEQLDHTGAIPSQFQITVHEKLQRVKDSLQLIQDTTTGLSLTNYLLRNISTIDYNSLKDSLSKFYPHVNEHRPFYVEVIIETAKQQPEFIFKLAKDLPEYRNEILAIAATSTSRKEYWRLLGVEGYNEMKKELSKNRIYSRDQTPLIYAGLIGTGAAVLLAILLID